MDVRTCFVLLASFMSAVSLPERVLETYTSHPCMRPCKEDRPQNCYYDFHLDLYITIAKACYNCPFNKTDCFRPHCISANGVQRSVLVVNKMLPGPGIHVCEGDTIVVNVVNGMTGGEGTSIHWHGVLQHGSQHMDGVGMVTQCPIPTKTSFEYRFEAATPGTHFWHAHSGLQRSDGLFGALVIRQTDEDEPHNGLYEEDLAEHTILVNDWLVEMAVDRFARYNHAGGDDEPRAILINGKGMYQSFINQTDNATSYTPVEVFHVTKGKTYRFRAISAAAMNCPMQISIDDHNLTMIASDGSAFEKIEVESFNIFTGERFDFVLDTSLSVGNYWVRVRGLADCGVYQAKQVAILRYEGAPVEDPSGDIAWEDNNRPGKNVNAFNQKSNDTYVSVADLKSILDVEDTLKGIPARKYYLSMDFNKVDNYHFHDSILYPVAGTENVEHTYTPQINHMSLTLPPSPPLSQLSDLDESIFCDHETTNSRNCSVEYCECVYRLKVDHGDLVEMVIIGESVTIAANHPMHLHGFRFHVVGMDKLAETTSLSEVKRMDEEGKLSRNLDNPVAKDTVTVPDGGYTIIRFIANNPGVWFFHCHIEFHVDMGMGILIQVGDIMPTAPRNFPKCGNFKFSGYLDDDNADNEDVDGGNDMDGDADNDGKDDMNEDDGEDNRINDDDGEDNRINEDDGEDNRINDDDGEDNRNNEDDDDKGQSSNIAGAPCLTAVPFMTIVMIIHAQLF